MPVTPLLSVEALGEIKTTEAGCFITTPALETPVKIPIEKKFHNLHNIAARLFMAMNIDRFMRIENTAPMSRDMWIPSHDSLETFNSVMSLQVRFRGRTYAMPRHTCYWDAGGLFCRRQIKTFEVFDYRPRKSIKFSNKSTGKLYSVYAISLSVTKNRIPVLTVRDGRCVSKASILINELRHVEIPIHLILIKFHKFTAGRECKDTWFPTAYVQAMILDEASLPADLRLSPAN